MTQPNWYPDPHQPGQLRYWDGAAWTGHTAPLPPQAPTGIDTGPKSALHYMVPVGRSWQSVVAPYLGLISLLPIPFLSVLIGAGGIGLGIVALRRARTGGHGSGRAWTAIVLGGIGVVIGAVATVYVLTFS